MANIRKSFNLRNGVQVDDDNFIVNPNGLVGIGTSLPTAFLDVYGTAKFTGLVTTTNLVVTGVSTFFNDVKVGSAITLTSSGDVRAGTFFGSAAGLTGIFAISTSGWIINAGNISTTSKVGIGTTLPSSQLDVVGDVRVSGIITASNFSGYQSLIGAESSATKTFVVRISSKTSNHRYNGNGSTSAYFIDGIESPFLTLLPGKTYRFDQSDASNSGNRLGFYLEADRTTTYNTNVTTTAESPGTAGSYTEIIVTDTTPVVLHYQSSSSAYIGNAVQFNSNIVNTPYQITTLAGISATTGVVTAYSFSGFGTNIQGINATNITNGTLNNSRLPQSISITGIITASSGVITSITSTNLNNIGFATLGITSISNLTVGGGVTINSNLTVGDGVTITSASIFAPTGIITASTFVGGLVGIASTARDLTSNARVNIADIQSQTSSIGISTVSTRLYAESIGVGTNSPSSDIHIRRTGQSKLQVTSDTAEAIIAVGRSTNLIGSNGALIFGNTSGLYPYSNSRTLDIVNYDTGNLNYYLQLNSAGTTGSFNWFHGPSADILMSLTHQGNLGIGVTNPTNKLQVSGNISGSSLSLSGNITAIGAGTSTSVNSLYVYGGKSQILNSNGTQIFPPGEVGSNLNITSGISTFYDINVNGTGFFNQSIGIGNTNPQGELHIGEGDSSILITSSGIGIGTDDIPDVGVFLYSPDYSAVFSVIGIGTTTPTSALTVVGDVSVSGILTAKNSLTLATAQNVSGLGTSVDFTDIPSWVKRITVMFDGVSRDGASVILVRIGDSGGIETNDYVSYSVSTAITGVGGAGNTTGFLVNSTSASHTLHGAMYISLLSENTWVSTHAIANPIATSGANGFTGSGSKTLSGTLDRIRVTTEGGVNTFDNGFINIMYE